MQVFAHNLLARVGRGVLAWRISASSKLEEGARSVLGVPKSTRVELLGVPAHFNEAVPPDVPPRTVLLGSRSKLCVRMESVNDSKGPISKLHEKYRLKCRSIRSTSAPMICVANEILVSIIYIR